MKPNSSLRLVLCFFLGCVLASAAPNAPFAASRASVPIIYTSDLFHPHDDPDDHFDLATLFALREFDIRAIVIDCGPKRVERAGIVPLRQMMHIAGRKVPHAVGLTDNLKSETDDGQDARAPDQAGVALILQQLRAADSPVTVFTAGSLRDVAAAFNREPDLLKAKVARLYINAGHSNGGPEWNVKLDPAAYVRMMNSGLPVYWVPCFGESGYQSLWSFRHGDVLDAAPLALQNFFVYALTKAQPDKRDPLKSLADPIDKATREKIWNQQRKMWCTAAFLHAAGRSAASFNFEKVFVQTDAKGISRITSGPIARDMQVFRQTDPAAYPKDMTLALRQLLAARRN